MSFVIVVTMGAVQWNVVLWLCHLSPVIVINRCCLSLVATALLSADFSARHARHSFSHSFIPG